jgi:MFS family permease
MLFTTLLTTGQLIFAIGGSQEPITNNSYWIMLAGRFVFGLGGECMSVCSLAIISQWFKGKELAFAFGMNMSISGLIPTVTGIVGPRIASEGGVGETMWVGFGACVFSWFCGLTLVFVEKYADKKDGTVAKLADEDKFECRYLCAMGLPFWLMLFSCVLTYAAFLPYTANTATMLTS